MTRTEDRRRRLDSLTGPCLRSNTSVHHGGVSALQPLCHTTRQTKHNRPGDTTNFRKKNKTFFPQGTSSAGAENVLHSAPLQVQIQRDMTAVSSNVGRDNLHKYARGKKRWMREA